MSETGKPNEPTWGHIAALAAKRLANAAAKTFRTLTPVGAAIFGLILATGAHESVWLLVGGAVLTLWAIDAAAGRTEAMVRAEMATSLYRLIVDDREAVVTVTTNYRLDDAALASIDARLDERVKKLRAELVPERPAA